MNFKEAYLKSSDNMLGNYWKVIGIYFFIAIISFVISFLSSFIVTGNFINYDISFGKNLAINIVVNIFTIIFTFGVEKIYLSISNEQKYSIGFLFEGFKYLFKVLFLKIIASIFILLWSILLIIPGIIKSISYIYFFFILNENPKLRILEVINLSKKFTYGKKWEIVKLFFYSLRYGILLIIFAFIELSVVGAHIFPTLLGGICFITGFCFAVRGILIFYVGLANLYNEAKKENI